MDINQILICPVAVVELSVVARLGFLRLHRRYIWFAAYLSADTLQGILFAIFGLSPADARYFRIWIAVIPILWLLQAGVALELYWRVCEHYRNFARVGRWLLVASAIGAVGICAVTLRLDLGHVDWRWPVYWGALLAQRCVTFVLAAFLGMSALFFVRFRVPIRRNVLVHGWLIAGYFAARALSAMAYILRMNPPIAATAHMLVQVPLFLAWIVLLSKKGETVDVWPEATEAEYAAERARTAGLIDIARKL